MALKVLLVDADSTTPNLALMKLSTFYKAEGAEVDFLRLNIPYYPGRRKVVHTLPTGYDSTHCSVIFDGSIAYVDAPVGTDFGGTGFCLKKTLPKEVESLDPDYSLYPENDTSYGFISRGCIRDCWFCKVREKEGLTHQVSTVGEIVKHRKVKFLDNNIFSLPNAANILKEIADSRVKCQFSQGLDIRLLTPELSRLLSKINHLVSSVTFAFDQYRDLPLIERKLELLEWRSEWQIKFFVYTSPETRIADVVRRVEWLRDNKCLPYLMRDISCWDSENSDFYVDLAAYCNQPSIVKKMSFAEFLVKRHPTGPRADKSAWLYYTNLF